VIRPADGPECAYAWCAALRRRDGPTALVLTRQNLPPVDRTKHAPADGLLRGGYVLTSRMLYGISQPVSKFRIANRKPRLAYRHR